MVMTRSQTIRSSEAPQSPGPFSDNSQHDRKTYDTPLNSQQVLAIPQIPETPAGSGEKGLPDGHTQMEFHQAPPDRTVPEDCLCCVDHTQLFEEHNEMIDEHEKHMREREVEIDGLYARVKGERRELEQLREEFLEQKSAQSQLLDRYAAHFSAREAEMERMFESLRGERAELRQYILRFLQEKQSQSEMLQKHEAQVGEAKRLLENAKDLKQTREAAAQQIDCLGDIFHTVWQFVDAKKGSAQ